MAIKRVIPFFSHNSSWRYELLFSCVGFIVAIGVCVWFIYGMVKDLRPLHAHKGMAEKRKRLTSVSGEQK